MSPARRPTPPADRSVRRSASQTTRSRGSRPREATLDQTARHGAQGQQLRVLMVTEGTYPFVVGGVSSWCDQLVGGLSDVDWILLPIVGGDTLRKRIFHIPPNVRLMKSLELWSDSRIRTVGARSSSRTRRDDLPGELLRGLLAWDANPATLKDPLLWCRQNPTAIRHSFRASVGWDSFLAALEELRVESVPDAHAMPEMDIPEASELYQTLYWVARCGAMPLPKTDVMHLTAAGWASLPAIAEKADRGTPVLLTEHGLYVREAYLGAMSTNATPGRRFITSRLARGLTRTAYAVADLIAPVTPAHTQWERAFDVNPDKIRTIPNGVRNPDEPTPLPRHDVVVSVGRIDPLKDVHTLLRVAEAVLKERPNTQFLHYGPIGEAQEEYARSVQMVYRSLNLGPRFRFMGSTEEPERALRAADVVLMTSISEGLPMTLLEAMSEARPIVSTGVGGVADVIHGCGLTTQPGDVHGLANAVCTLLEFPDMAEEMGIRGFNRVKRKYTARRHLDAYREALWDVSRLGAPTRAGTAVDRREVVA